MKKFLFGLCVGCISIYSLGFAGISLFKDMITKPVLEKAISELAKDFKREYPFTKHLGLTWSAGTYARHAVFEKEMGDDQEFLYASLAANFDNPEDYWVKKGGAKKSVLQLYENIMKAARNTLQSPDVLKAMYLSHKADAIDLIRSYGIADILKVELEAMLPYFDGTLDAKTVDLCESRRVAWQTWVNGGPYNNLYRLESDLYRIHHLVRRNFNYYEWPLRRKSEGGQQLIDTWTWIITDMKASL